MAAKYIRIANILREQIKSNIRAAGRKLPTEEELANRYGVSRQTIREALKLLRSEGLIATRQGSGTVISGGPERESSKKIAVIISSDSEYIYPGLISDIKAVFRKNGYTTKIMTTHHSWQKEREYLATVLEGNYAGLIVEPVKNAYPGANPDLCEKIKSKGTHIVFLGGRYVNFPDYPFVKSDDVYGGYLACRMLVKKNHKDIVCLLNRDTMSGIDRYQGILMALNDSENQVKDNMCTWYITEDVIKLRENQDCGFVRDFVKKNIRTASAVICMNDEIAYQVVKELIGSGCEVPADMSVVSFDNSFLSVFERMQITTMAHNAHELGRTVAQTIMKLINGQPSASSKISWHIVSGESDSICEKNQKSRKYS